MSGIREALAEIDAHRNTWCCKCDHGEWFACTEAESHQEVAWRWFAGSSYAAQCFLDTANQPVVDYVQRRNDMVRCVVDRIRSRV